MLVTCEDDPEIKNLRYYADEGSELKFSSREFDNPVEYCQVEQPNGKKMHFSLVPDKENPNVIR